MYQTPTTRSKYRGSIGVAGVANGRRYHRQYVVPSESSSSEYIVTNYSDGRDPEWACACIGWTRHTPRRDCKHISYARAGGATSLEDAIANKLEGL
jgi:hypothetical protein